MSLTIQVLRGPEAGVHLDDLADLRIRVFRDYPYLYDGSRDYEAQYLATYARSPESLFVLALDGDRVVGAATGVPMADETEEFRAPFQARGYDPAQIFYFGESVLLPEYRGQGTGVRFFAEREKYAQALGRFRYTGFCAVDRPDNHPLRPVGYQPLDAFWQKRGYRRHPEFRSVYRWKDIDQPQAGDHVMTYWLKDWN